MGVCTKERKGVTAEVLRATPCTNSLGGEGGEHDDDVYYYIRWRLKLEERKVGFIENTAMRHRRGCYRGG